jgi:hypothetical protein
MDGPDGTLPERRTCYPAKLDKTGYLPAPPYPFDARQSLALTFQASFFWFLVPSDKRDKNAYFFPLR